MEYCVPDESTKKTARCCNDFPCLLTDECVNIPRCVIDKRYDKNMLHVKSVKDTDDISCSYKFTVGGNEHICTCPKHYDIYKQRKY